MSNISHEFIAAHIREGKERLAASLLSDANSRWVWMEKDARLIQYNYVAPMPKVHWAVAALFGAVALIKRNPAVERRALWGWLWRSSV
jgi:hypothetical protein